MIRLTTARNADFMTDNGMMGFIYAQRQVAKTVEMLKKYTKSAAQKKLAKIAFVDSPDWHYWANYVSDKYISLVQYALRRVGKGKDVDVLYNIYGKHALYKTPFLRYLEYLAAKNDYSGWKGQYIRSTSYLMSKDEATARAARYYQLLIKEFEV